MGDGSVDRYLSSEEGEVDLEWGVPHRGPRWAETVGKRAGKAQKCIFPKCCAALGQRLQLSGPPLSWQNRTDYCSTSTWGRGGPPALEHQRASQRLLVTGDSAG